MIGLLRRLLARHRLERELDAELQDHLARASADYERAGLDAAQARRRARLDLDGVEPTKEACRDVRGTRLLEDLGQDLVYGLRVLRRSPAFTVVTVLSLSLGIGANTAVFTLVDSLVLRALPVRDPARLVRLRGGSWTNPIWEQVRERQKEIFEGATAFSDTRFDLAQGGEADFAQGLFASGSFFDMLGVPPMLGRTFTLDDDRRGGGTEGPVAVISYGFWQRRFGGAADAVGRALVLNGVPFTIVGVTPPAFFGPTVGRSFDVAVPIGMVDRVQKAGADAWLDARSTWWLEILGRLRPGQDVASATRALQAVQPQIREATLPDHWSAENREKYLRESPLTLVPAANGFSELRGEYQRPLLTVMGVVVLVLLIGCANIASLQLARANARRQELGARLALGASRGRLLRQLLTESLLLAAPGGLLGLVVAQWGSRLLVAQIQVPGGGGAGVPVALDVALHGRVLFFTLAVTVATALLFGVAPALRTFGFSPYDAVRPGGGGGASKGALDGRLVVFQVALSLVLVFAAGLFVRTFARLDGRDIGLAREGILLVNLDAQRCTIDPPERRALYERIREAAAAVPGVQEASVSLVSPVSGMAWNEGFGVQGEAELSGLDRLSWVNAVTPGWFSTYGTPLLGGRDFDVHDRAGSPPVAVVNEAFARRFAAGRSPIGRVALRDGSPDRLPRPLEIVGLVRDTVYRSPRDEMEPILYLPVQQLSAEDSWPFATLSVRAVSPALLTRAVAAVVRRVDPRLSLSFRLFEEQVGTAIRRERVVAGLSAFFGVLALLLAGIGLYGVTAYSVSRRRTEIAVRMALGAEAKGVLRLVLEKALRPVALGLAIGALVSLWAARFVGSLLYGVQARDLPTLLGVAAILAVVCALAAALPAQRAARIDPARVLREG